MNIEKMQNEIEKIYDKEEDIETFFENVKNEYKDENLYLLLEKYYYKGVRLFLRNGEYKNFNAETNEEVRKIFNELLDKTIRFVENPCVWQSPGSPNRHLCDNKCSKCISRKHWNEIINNKPHHFVDEENNVFYITDVGNGGFYNSIFNVEFNGKTFQCGLWSNGKCTDYVAEQIPNGKIIRR